MRKKRKQGRDGTGDRNRKRSFLPFCEEEKNKHEKEGLPGSYTVEAAILVPILLAVIMLMIQLILSSHDRIIFLEAIEYRALLYTQDPNQEDYLLHSKLLEAKRKTGIEFEEAVDPSEKEADQEEVAKLSREANEAGLTEAIGQSDKEFFDECKKQLTISTIEDLQIEKKAGKVKIKATLETKSLIPIFFVSKSKWKKEYQCERSIPNAKKKTLICEAIFETVDEIRGK